MASIGGARGVLVVGGATGDDLVEFLDWDARDQWRKLGRLNRGRGMVSIQGLAWIKFLGLVNFVPALASANFATWEYQL